MKFNFKYILIILIISLFFIRKKNMEGLEGDEENDDDIKYLQVLGGGLVGLLIGLSIGFAYYFFNTDPSDPTPQLD